MDTGTRALISKRVTHEISSNLIKQLGGNMETASPDAIREQDWVALTTMLMHLRHDVSTLIENVLANENGGLAYMAMLTVIHDKILDIAKVIEETLGIRTAWFPEVKIERAKTGDKAGDYFYTKLRKEVEQYLEDKHKEDAPCK